MACKVVLHSGVVIRDTADAELAAKEAWGCGSEHYRILELTDPGDEHKTYVPLSGIAYIEEEIEEDDA